MHHLIKKQIIELLLDKGLNYYQVQQQVSDSYWNEMVPLLEKAFDSVSREDEIMEIDKFELDLGKVSRDKIGNDDWMEEIRKKVEEKLAAITNPASSQYSVRLKDRRLGIIGQWFFYMDHGYLLWNSGNMDDNWHQDVLEALAVDFNSFQTVKQKLLRDSFFLKRIVTQHSDYFLQKLTEIITAEKQETLPGAIDELLLLHHSLQKRKKILRNVSDKELRNNLWQRLLIWASSGHTAIAPSATAEKLPVILYKQYLKELGNRLRNEDKRIEMAVQDLDIAKNKTSEEGAGEKQISKYNGRDIDEEGLFIVNAGTVLLHPFLKSLFSRLGLIKDDAFVNEHSQETSLCLIHYLSTGQTDAREFELALAKVLCAYSLEKPVEPAEMLSDEFIREADKLLEAAISQWEILKNTSVGGLREGFLQRPGKLFSKNGNLYLQVEKSSIDVLLDRLPWNLNIVRLPWMKDILRVEWR